MASERIDRATDGDVEAIADLLLATFHSTWAPEMTAERQREWLASGAALNYIAGAWPRCFVLRDESGVAGMVDFEGCMLHSLHVSPARQRLGYGRKLLAFVENRTAEDGHSVCRLETDTFNRKARAFYAAMGYREIEQYPDTEWNAGFTTVLMEKSLLAAS
jgi:ribosomal protein S18 acetylase RimI-like enzyme